MNAKPDMISNVDTLEAPVCIELILSRPDIPSYVVGTLLYHL